LGGKPVGIAEMTRAAVQAAATGTQMVTFFTATTLPLNRPVLGASASDVALFAGEVQVRYRLISSISYIFLKRL
jgi:hypothetical protein